jgi:hypothetical protein
MLDVVQSRKGSTSRSSLRDIPMRLAFGVSDIWDYMLMLRSYSLQYW